VDQLQTRQSRDLTHRWSNAVKHRRCEPATRRLLTPSGEGSSLLANIRLFEGALSGSIGGVRVGRRIQLTAANTKYLVIVPKVDEVRAILPAFRLASARPEHSNGVRIYRRGDLALAMLNQQNNTNSAALCCDLLLRMKPLAAVLVGTAMGSSGLVGPSVGVWRGRLEDISESEIDSPYEFRKRVVETSAQGALLLDEVLTSATYGDRCTKALRRVSRVKSSEISEETLRAFEDLKRPFVELEPMASGNIYFNQSGETAKVLEAVKARLWDKVPGVKFYDMEGAGFARACEVAHTPGFIFRGISDMGSRSTMAQENRNLASAMAGVAASEFLEGIERRDDLSKALVEYRSGDLSLVKYRYDGTWKGGFMYLDDDGKPSFLADREVILFQDERSNVTGKAISEAIEGSFHDREAGYLLDMWIDRGGAISGTWASEKDGVTYRGVLMGNVDAENAAIVGKWIGSHRGGLHNGVFMWHLVTRDGKPIQSSDAPKDDRELMDRLGLLNHA